MTEDDLRGRLRAERALRAGRPSVKSDGAVSSVPIAARAVMLARGASMAGSASSARVWYTSWT